MQDKCLSQAVPKSAKSGPVRGQIHLDTWLILIVNGLFKENVNGCIQVKYRIIYNFSIQIVSPNC